MKNQKNKYIEKLNKFIYILLGKRWKVVLINEYPKCGATWLRSLICDYLNINTEIGNNNKEGNINLIKKKSVIQRHWIGIKNKYKMILVIRDPRDVYNSFYFHEVYHNPSKEVLKTIQFNSNKPDKENLESYIFHKLNNPKLGTPGFSYESFWNFYKQLDNVFIVKYEDLHNNAFEQLQKIFTFLEIPNINNEKILEVIKTNSFENKHKRKKGEENKTSHARKGVVGDWKNNFNKNSIKFIEYKLRTLLNKLSY